MIKNYIKLAWRVLGRKKFFTFISLFGISFTLGILMVVISFLQSELGANSPLGNKDDLIMVDQLRLQRILYDTLTVIDTIDTDGFVQYDTSYTYNRTGSWQWNGEVNNGIGEEYFKDVPGIEDKTIYSTSNSHNVFVNGVKIEIQALYGDPSYWNIFDHKIIEGRVFDQQEMDNAAKVIVLSTKMAEAYFGSETGVVGEEMLIEGKNYKVIGIYPDLGKIIPYVSPDAVIPYSNLELENQDTYYHGFFEFMFKMKPGQDLDVIRERLKDRADLIPLDHPSKPDGYNEVVFNPKSYNEMYAQGIYYERDASKSLSIMKVILIGLLLFFVFLPTINLINLNVSRIMDRSSEIGVRKAFGATQKNIIAQFIIENIVQTLIGGLLGLALALFLINLLNNGGYLGNANLSLSPSFFLYSFIVTLLFGALSGFIPAYRMSKLQIVNALKENQL